MKKKLAALALALTLLTVPAAAFSDVDEGLYYAAPIAWAVEQGITTGTTETTFSPDDQCTQGQILTFLWRAAGRPVTGDLPAALAAWPLNADFQKAITWACETGILAAGDSLDPTAPCDRGSAMKFLWRYAGAPVVSAPGTFTDVDPGADYAPAVIWAVEQDIVEGTTESTFSPSEICTRGQIATFLYRCLNEAGEKTGLPGESAPAPAQEPENPPLRALTGQGTAYSLGLDGSEYTSNGIYAAEVTVEVYSAYDAVFTVKAPFPLYQACNYTVYFDDPDAPGKGCQFTCLRWDEAFADMIPWEGEHLQYRFTDTTESKQSAAPVIMPKEEDRIGGVISWRVLLTEGDHFNFDRAENYQLSCKVNSNL